MSFQMMSDWVVNAHELAASTAYPRAVDWDLWDGLRLERLDCFYCATITGYNSAKAYVTSPSRHVEGEPSKPTILLMEVPYLLHKPKSMMLNRSNQNECLEVQTFIFAGVRTDPETRSFVISMPWGSTIEIFSADMADRLSGLAFKKELISSLVYATLGEDERVDKPPVEVVTKLADAQWSKVFGLDLRAEMFKTMAHATITEGLT